MWRCLILILILLSSCLQLALQPGVGLLGTAQASFHDLQAELQPSRRLKNSADPSSRFATHSSKPMPYAFDT